MKAGLIFLTLLYSLIFSQNALSNIESTDGNWLVFTSEKTGTGFLYALNLKKAKAVPVRLTKGIHQTIMEAARRERRFLNRWSSNQSFS